MTAFRQICVFCGSSAGANGDYVEAARTLGTTLARRGIGLVYGGGRVGLMGVLADATLAAGGTVTGVIPRALATKEIAHAELTQLHVVESMHERKALMAQLSDAFAALPGGLGTLEELFEVATWSQLGFHQKPIGLLNVAGYFDPLLGFLDHAVAERFLVAEHRRILGVASTVEQLLQVLESAPSEQRQKWIQPGET